jgi:hypothetical protein
MRTLAVEKRFNMSDTSRSRKQGFLRMCEWGWLVLLAFAMFAPQGALAQLTGKGTITGSVTDKTGAVIPNADVTAMSDSTGITTATKSTGAGAYTFAALDPGTYTVTIAAPGFQKLSQKNLHVNVMESTSYNPVLTVGGADTQITVTAAPPQLETSNATLGATMENEMYAELPIEMGAYGQADQRRATDFAFLMPGVQGNNTTGNATTNTGVINGSGSRGGVSAVYIDGIPFVRAGGNGDPRFVWSAISVDAVDQFQVQTTGYPAIYEGQGVMNYTIKAGGNKYHASVYEFFRNTALDTWGFWGKAVNSVTGVATKPVEHSNEYGINIGGPLVPFGKWKDKVFVFGNYNGYRYTSATPTPITLPTAAQQAGDFSATGVNIYDPLTQAACTAANSNKPCRYQYSYNGVKNAIDPTKFSTVAKNMQSFLPSGIGTALQNNYIASNSTGLVNWSTTERIDYFVNSRDTLSLLFADGRQASSVPVGQATTGRNVGPVPYNYGQAYAPKTIVAAIEETHTFSANLLNQFKLGFARYNGPTFSSNQQPNYAASTLGITGQPTGQAQDAFPIVTFAGTDAPTNWSGTTANVTIASNYTLLDNLQWNIGKHSFTFGGQIAWMQYNVQSATGGSTPLTLAYAVTETAALPGSFTVTPSTGLAYASFLVGEPDKTSFTQYIHPVIGTRFRPISGYVQDNWKLTSKLTLDLGLRYDFFPTLTEVNNAMSYFNPNLANPVTGINGALEFTGHGANTCNCSTPVHNYYKNIGPRFGAAYQLNSKTVVRASYGVMYTHGDAVGGGATTLGGNTVNNGLLGYSSSPSFAANSSDLSTAPMHGTSGAIPTYTTATGAASGPAYGTGYTNTANYTSSPSSMGYADSYLGSRAPQFLNWSFGIQRQLTNALTLTTTYVGSEGHFLQADGSNAHGYWADQLDPKYLYLGSHLSDTSKTATTNVADCTTYSLNCPANFLTTQSLATWLKPFPFQSVSDAFAYVANSHYHGLQVVVNMRASHGFTINSNFTWSRSIDNGGTFRTGYAIPAGTLANHSDLSYKADAIERSVSTSNQPLHFVLTTVWNWPFGKTILNSNTMERAVLGGFKLSGIYQAYSGSPLTLTESSCQTNPAQSTCQPIMNPNFTGSARQNGKWGHGATTANYTSKNYVVPSTGTTVATAAGPFMNPVSTVLSSYAYKFSDAPRTAPYNLNGPGNYQLDLALVRSFPLHITEASKLNFRAEWYNVTNHTLFGVASTAVGNASFGQVTNNTAAARKSAQFSARIEF